VFFLDRLETWTIVNQGRIEELLKWEGEAGGGGYTLPRARKIYLILPSKTLRVPFYKSNIMRLLNEHYRFLAWRSVNWRKWNKLSKAILLFYFCGESGKQRKCCSKGGGWLQPLSLSLKPLPKAPPFLLPPPIEEAITIYEASTTTREKLGFRLGHDLGLGWGFRPH